ncbi:MAG TPA: chorismate mutase [Caulobacteraceae bacterium]
MDDPRPSLSGVRARIDQVDSALLALVEERAGLAKDVVAAKAAEASGPPSFGLRPAREAQVLRGLLAKLHAASDASTIVSIWRQLIGESLSLQGPFHVTAWGGDNLARAVELARLRFGAAPQLAYAKTPEDALAAARTLGGVGVLALTHGNGWWKRLLAEPKVRVFAALPCLKAWGPMSALAAAVVPIEQSGSDDTFWVTDAPGSPESIVEALGHDGVAACQVQASDGLRLFKLAGFYLPEDERLKRAPGRLKGVIGAAPTQLDL